MLYVVIRLAEQVKRNEPAFVILETTVLPDGLHANAVVHKLPLKTPSLALFGAEGVLVHQVRLPGTQLRKHQHPWPRRVYSRSLFEEVRGGPGVIYPDGRVSPYPHGHERGFVCPGKLLEPQPGLIVRQHEGVAHNGKRQRPRRLCDAGQ